jgi:hypothetical protein
LVAHRCRCGRYDVGIAEPYLTQLLHLAELWNQADDRVGVIECRHFFSGAAAYRKGSIVASLTPVGLAFKVPHEVRDALMQRGRVTELRYFPKAPIKREYVLFDPKEDVPAGEAALLILGYDPIAEQSS